MANSIIFSELHTVGYQLFQDSETFLNDLSEIDSMAVYGGGVTACVTVGVTAGVTVGVTVGVTASLNTGLTATLTAGLTNSLTSSIGW
ncbi:hypothetical protein I8748_28140 [Nostoc sp. CENA67]|uniref:Uncharacterized protein n=1 Tax=Amazonocrinis nigriterrae CENA67 TaxID=2794033 RepID=A0A8J7LAY0_9NOST|nr:hypothetical protein [Amazonocrinis nigriterrae]MBH8565988.1 hypothetical protein [Amazonocrinis nigriterrae CENA67]